MTAQCMALCTRPGPRCQASHTMLWPTLAARLRRKISSTNYLAEVRRVETYARQGQRSAQQGHRCERSDLEALAGPLTLVCQCSEAQFPPTRLRAVNTLN